MSSDDRKRDDVSQWLELQQRTIHRTARWWIDAVGRFQRGDLEPGAWIESTRRWFDGVRGDAREIDGLMPLDRKRAGKENDGGRKKE